jgi:DNA-binding protein HU-beta
MNKKDIARSLTRILSTQKEAKDSVDRVFNEMRKALRDGEKVVISGFGSFHPFVARARKGRNPKTGQPLQLLPRKKIRFRQAKDLFRI